MSRPIVAGTKSDDEVVEMMIGRELSHVFPPKPPAREDERPPLLEVKNLGWADRLHDISFHARAGEIVGLGGLDGQGQRELLLALFGVLRGVSGEMRVAGRARLAFEPPRGEIAGSRHGAHPRGPQDGRADVADVGLRKPLLRGA